MRRYVTFHVEQSQVTCLYIIHIAYMIWLIYIIQYASLRYISCGTITSHLSLYYPYCLYDLTYLYYTVCVTTLHFMWSNHKSPVSILSILSITIWLTYIIQYASLRYILCGTITSHLSLYYPYYPSLSDLFILYSMRHYVTFYVGQSQVTCFYIIHIIHHYLTYLYYTVCVTTLHFMWDNHKSPVSILSILSITIWLIYIIQYASLRYILCGTITSHLFLYYPYYPAYMIWLIYIILHSKQVNLITFCNTLNKRRKQK